MIDDPFTPEEEKLIQQIRATAKPKLDPAARDAIRQQMLNEFRAIPFQRPVTRFPVYVAVAAAIVVIGFIGFFLANQPGAAPTPDQVAIVPSETPIAPSETPVVPSETPVMPSETPFVPSETPVMPSETPFLPSETPAPTQEMNVIIEGPVTNIDGNVVTVYGFEVELEPEHPILNIVDEGDVVRVQGAFNSDGTVAASVVGNITGQPVTSATVGLEGPIESIDGNTLVVNGVRIQLAPDDPLLRTIRVGNFVRAEGNFQTSGATIVLTVVNIAILNNVTAIENECWYHDTGMGMGHWHCDGMGMGSPGMGEPSGMGASNNAGMGNSAGQENNNAGMGNNAGAGNNSGMGNNNPGMGMGMGQ